MVIKFGVIAAIAKVLGNRWPTSIRLGVTLAQGGEFAFVLFSVATAQNVLRPELANTLNLIVTISMALTPLAFLLLEKSVSLYLLRVNQAESMMLFQTMSIRSSLLALDELVRLLVVYCVCITSSLPQLNARQIA